MHMMLNSRTRETETCLLLISTMLLKIEFDKIHMTCVCVCMCKMFLFQFFTFLLFFRFYVFYFSRNWPPSCLCNIFFYKLYLIYTFIYCPLDTDFNLVQPLLSFVCNIFFGINFYVLPKINQG